jgi:hypothetical protein
MPNKYRGFLQGDVYPDIAIGPTAAGRVLKSRFLIVTQFVMNEYIYRRVTIRQTNPVKEI